MPLGADPHEFAPSARQAEAMAEADLLVVNGADFEAGMSEVVDAAADTAPVFAAADHVELLLLDGDEDPHLWTDPTRVAAVAQALGARLAEVDGVDAAALAPLVDAYLAELVTPRRRRRAGAVGRAGRAARAGDGPRGVRLLRRPLRLRGARGGDPVAHDGRRGVGGRPRGVGHDDQRRRRADDLHRDHQPWRPRRRAGRRGRRRGRRRAVRREPGRAEDRAQRPTSA